MRFFLHRKISGSLFCALIITLIISAIDARFLYRDVHVSPHDLRRYSASYASRNGVPPEVVSKVILRHQDLKTTQIYLGKISDSEAIRWMDNLHGK
jgi:integrase